MLKLRSCGPVLLMLDGVDEQNLAFDSMQYRAPKPPPDFARQEIVLDVPPETSRLAFGVVLAGTGEVWAKEIVIEVVGE